jgi:MFS family permease
MTPPPPDVPDRIPREIWILIASSFLVAVGFGLITPVLPQFAQSFGVGATASSVVISAFAFFRLVGAPAGGRLVSRLGERPVYLTGLLVVAGSTAATGFAQSYGQLLLFRSLGGIGSTMFTVSALALIVRMAPTAIRGRVSASWASTFLIGAILGPVLGGLLGGLGLRVPFLVYAAMLLMAALVVAVFIPRGAGGPDEQHATAPPLGVREALRDSAYRAALGSAFANGWSNFGVRNAILPLFAATVVGDAPWVAGAALAVFAAGNAGGLAIAGRLTDRIGRRPFVLTGLGVSGVATGLTGWAGGLVVLVVLSVVAGVGAGVLNPAQQAGVADVIGRERSGGPALAVFSMAQDAGAIAGPIVAGTLVDHGSYPLAFVATGVITLLAAGPWLAARETLDTSRTGP